ncbi:MAG TPA: response regulator transcription factor [Sandaracinaceae bacterium LLY-WYZ-13_1]|nr:response regulator transcription factor [Sandaracinaceae bacterium LLY-WYZ-13_1]
MMSIAVTEEPSPRVLLVEDEEPILDGLDALFSGQGFVTVRAPDGARALDELADGGFDLVVLDLMIPRVDGLTVLRRTRQTGDDTPVLVLTAKGAEDDVVAGLEAGADDYVTKPFGVRELVARARGLMRRPRAERERPRRFRVGGVELDLDAQLAREDGDGVRLTAREALLIGYLLERRHRPVTREELLVDVWGYHDGTVRTRTVDVHVQQLRAKLRALPGGEGWIATVRGRGYRFVAPVEDD